MLPFNWLVFDRGDAVAVILYKKDSKEIILTRQFRAPTLRYRKVEDQFVPSNDGQLDETIAGMQRGNENVEDCAIREVWEETGYIIDHNRLEKIALFYPSPGGTSERIYLFYAEITDADRDPKRSQEVAGVEKDAESILVKHIPLSRFLSTVSRTKEPIDSKVLIASLLLQARKTAPEAAVAERRCHELKHKPGHFIVLRTGDISHIEDVDAWVNSENTDMEMDRFVASTVSAKIRYLGAAKNAQGRVIEDTIADALKRAINGRVANIGSVYSTEPGDLKKKNVKRIFHVAAVYGIMNEGFYAEPRFISIATRNVLSAVEERNKEFFTSRCKSVLLPMMGTGDHGLTTEQAFPKILESTLSFFTETSAPKLTSVHICAFKVHDADIARTHLDGHRDLDFRA